MRSFALGGHLLACLRADGGGQFLLRDRRSNVGACNPNCVIDDALVCILNAGLIAFDAPRPTLAERAPCLQRLQERHATSAVAFDKCFFVMFGNDLCGVRRVFASDAVDLQRCQCGQTVSGERIDRALQILNRLPDAGIDCVIEYGIVNASGQVIASGQLPISRIINVCDFDHCDRLHATQLFALRGTISVVHLLRYALVRRPAGVFRVINITAFVREYERQNDLILLGRHRRLPVIPTLHATRETPPQPKLRRGSIQPDPRRSAAALRPCAGSARRPKAG